MAINYTLNTVDRRELANIAKIVDYQTKMGLIVSPECISATACLKSSA